MLKTANNRITPACARFLACAALLLSLATSVHAQGYYTLTNGQLWWSNGTVDQADEDWRDPIAFDASRQDASGNWMEVHPHGNEHVTQITAQGDTYLALNISDPLDPKIDTKSTFDLYCVWQRTGYTGYYFQEWYNAGDGNTYSYYLVANSAEQKLEIAFCIKGQALPKSTYWYDWDFGAAAWETPIVNGAAANRYYWMMLQKRDRTTGSAVTPVWTLSHHTYQRPEAIYYTEYTGNAATDAANLRHYDEDVFHDAAGEGALFLPVTITIHDESVIAVGLDGTTPYGLQYTADPTTHLTLHTGITVDDPTLEYDPANEVSTTLTANMHYATGNTVPMTVMPAYTEYVEETYRRGIHLNWRYRNEESFGSAGVGTYEHHNYWGGTDHGSAIPSQTTDNTTVDTIIFSVDSRSARYVSIDTIYPISSANGGKAELLFHSPCSGTYTAEVYVTVRYHNGTVQRDTTTVTLHYEKPTRTFDQLAGNGPIIRGAVFGGGRMANVGGCTEMYIHSTDSISTVYGGNDIAGWVQGDAGANMQIGTEFTSKDHPVHIRSVYGGGNGYYTYQGINAGYDEATGTHINPYYLKQSTSLIYQAYYFRGKVYPWNSLPAGYLASASEADRLNHDKSAWNSLTPVSSHEFDYTPFNIGRPDLVDQSENGEDGDGTIPYIKTAHIIVGVPEGNTPFVCEHGTDSTHWYNDHILIDTLFGGARNAFIGVTANEGETPENGVSIDINGGTLFAVFGGNNVGGSVANTSTVFVRIHDTKLIHKDAEIHNTYFSGYGRDFGIRYLYGGGNFVDGSHANVCIMGGLIDTAFLGGNAATVMNPLGLVECLHGTVNGFGYPGHFIATNPTFPDSRLFPDNNPLSLYESNPTYFDDFGPDTYVPEVGKYNVRCLYGGNNSADMANLTLIQLHSGGVSCVYGGGNEGDMTNDQTFDIPLDQGVGGTALGAGTGQLFSDPLYNALIKQSFDINPATGEMLPGGWADVYGKATMPQKIGTIVTSLSSSKIVCDYVFGGCRMGNVKNSCGVRLAGGIFGYVNGGNDVSGDIGSETGETACTFLDSNVLVVGYTLGGSDGFYHCDDGEGKYDDFKLYDIYEGEEFSYDPYNDYVGLYFPTHNRTNVYLRGGLVLGQILAGGSHADVGFDLGKTYKIKKYNPATGDREVYDLNPLGGPRSGAIRFMAKSGRVLGQVFGGGYQSNIFGLSYLTVRGDAQIDGSFFCGNDCTGSVRGFGAYYNTNVYEDAIASGMSEEAALEAAYTAMVASDGTAINEQDEGGTWGAIYKSFLRIEDTPRIGAVYGGGNGAYDYNGDRPIFEEVIFCPPSSVGEEIRPLQSSAFIDIHTSGPHHYTERGHIPVGIDTVFGGGNGVGVEDNVRVLLNNTEPEVHSVHTIFGGNNIDDMNNVVPNIVLLKGTCNTVFGGANNGGMGANWPFTDALGYEVTDVSTHVVLNTSDVTVLDTVFGGSRIGNISGNTFVEVYETDDGGVDYIFGGNDVSGTIEGSTRVDVSGGIVHNLYGGSDGRYDYVEVGDGLFRVYPYGSVKTNDTTRTEVINEGTPEEETVTHSRCIAIAPRPNVDSTSVNLWGGTVGETTGGVYGGGSMADCRTTSVTVNDTASKADGTARDGELTILGTVYGGGMGDYENLNNKDPQGGRYGDVNENTHVNLYHAKQVTSAIAYGGGRGGDVMNTYITTYSGWDSPFKALYGGCWGSDVHSTAHLEFNGINLVHNLFGGNDFAGDVYKTIITVNSGRFFNIYGAGNGDYPDADYNTGVYEDIPGSSGSGGSGGSGEGEADDPTPPVIRHLHRPNTEYVEITFNNGTVDSNFYGGGKLGTCFTYQKDPSTGEYLLDENDHKIPDTTVAYSAAHSNPLDYSYVLTNIHGGSFANNVFAGARGNTSVKNVLIYGIKVLNMDGGHIYKSLYGGSESVNDGYPSECKTTSLTTRRASTIINLTGGTVESNLYGAGYLGLTHGSVYVNLGHDAIDSCKAYSRAYKYGGIGSADSAYRIFKPGVQDGLSPAIIKTDLLLNHSLYAGANWGAGGGSADFTSQGFYGGETKIRVDGLGYNTDNDELNYQPTMNIAKSIFCSGTSVEGGDISGEREIDVWNYGSLVNCLPTRTLESVQRSDELMFHKAVIEITGAIDATSAYQSIPYSLKNIYHARFRGYNVIEFDATIDNVPDIHFYEEPVLVDGTLTYVPIQHLRQYTGGTDACGDAATYCGNLVVVDPVVVDKQHTVLILNNGIDFEVARNTTPSSPGNVSGFSYVFTPVGYSSTILATATGLNGTSWITPGYYDWDSGLGGFASPCDTTNKYTADRGIESWNDFTPAQSSDAEYPYTNYDGSSYNDYRVWHIGKGTRLRETAILAHAVPDSLAQDVSILTHGNSHMAIAEATMSLPATSTGHYFKLKGGITLTSENETVTLIDSAFLPAQDFTTLDTYYDGGGSVDVELPIHGKFLSTSLDGTGVSMGVKEIIDHPTNTFGLIMAPGENFEGYSTEYYQLSNSTFVMPTLTDRFGNDSIPDVSNSMFILSGNSHVTSFSDYCTPKVTTGTELTPTMKFYLTYNTDFTTAFLGTAQFTLMEYDQNGREVGPIDVKVYISTIIEDFKPITTNVLAMYNDGRTNTFTRKIVLPATLEEDRELYLQSVYWEPTDGNGNSLLNSNKFFITGTENDITGAPAGVVNRFAIDIMPTDNVSNEVSSNLGWSRIVVSDTGIYSLKNQTERTRYSDSTAFETPRAIDLTSGGTSDGLLIGVLDGRGEAAFNVQLTFDGSRVYPATEGLGYVGKVVFNMASRLNGVQKTFPITVYVKTREHGDTIYLASASSVTRGGQTVRPYYENTQYNTLAGGTPDDRLAAAAMVGKSPNCYVQTFQEALNSNVYQEGDVIAILDKVTIGNGMNLSIHGGDGPAIDVIRYDGHHHEMATEAGVYRNGPMIEVTGDDTRFTVTNIAFHGGAGARIKNNATVDTKVPDTNRVFGPILQVKDNATVVLNEGTYVQHNWNAYGHNGETPNSKLMGAISLTDGGTLMMRNNVTVSQNLSHTFPGDNPANGAYDALQPYNGAVYIDGGHLVLPASNVGTAVTITDNYLVNPNIGTPGVCWWDTVVINNVPVRWAFRSDKVANWQKANVYLTRVKKDAPTGASDIAYYENMNDRQSDVIILSGALSADSRIGVRKWFPGPTDRDTIRIAVTNTSNLTILSQAVQDGVFLSDDDQRVFYNAKVNNNNIYLFRCATFRHQKAGANLPLAKADGSGYYTGEDVLDYGALVTSTCPVGGDTVLYRVQGGFAPYTFTWSGAIDRTYEKPFSNTQVQHALENEHDTSYYWASLVDTLISPRIEVSPEVDEVTAVLHAMAVDATGECKLYKDVTLNIHLVNDLGGHQLWEPTTTPANGWVDTNSYYVGARVTAEGDRYFKGVKITPMVYVDAAVGTIDAAILGADGYHVYRDVNEVPSALTGLTFCEGDQLFLKTTATGSGNTNKFIMWSFNPYTANPSTFVVPAQDETVVAYYGPNDYWKDVISSEALAGAELYEGYYYNGRTNPSSGYVTTYNGDVHIYDEKGLAWLISVVNGLNGTQARPMRFNRVYLHQKDAQGTPYDMKDHLWTPVGNLLYGFRGDLVCVGPSDTATTPLPEGQYVTVKHIILNEPNVDKVAFFALLDQARVRGLNLQNIFVRGGQYVSAMAASSTHSTLQGVGIDTRSEDLNNDGVVDAKTSILSTHYAVGGLVAESEGSRIDLTNVAHLKLVGNAVYVGGALARGDEDSVLNSSFIIINEVNSNVGGGVSGESNGAGPSGFFGRLFGRKGAGRSYIANNYVHVRNDGKVQSMGGLVGRSSNTVLENNYVYGNLSATGYAGAVAADMEDYTSADKNYYAEGSVEEPVGMAIGNVSLTDASSFSGSGNQVMLANPVYNGVDNLTLALNKWVREQNAAGAHFKTWRSDLDNVNNGYPVFGTPDMIPVVTNRLVEGCDEVVVDGILYSYDTVVSSHSVDYNEMVDSTVTTTIRLHATQYTALSDTATYGNDYEGHGFTITADELHMLGITLGDADSVSIILHDTLTTAFGCDSIVTLTLTFYASQDYIPQVIESVTTINVYPNPTTGVVTIDAEEMSHVEIYDNEGRRLQDYDAHNRNTLTIDISPYASGIYFVRIHTPHGVTIQKLIKR